MCLGRTVCKSDFFFMDIVYIGTDNDGTTGE
jgi:hypothetical protein